MRSYPVRYDLNQNLTVSEFLTDLETKINEGMKYRKSLAFIYDEGLENECACLLLQKSNMNTGGMLKLDNTDAIIQELPLNDYSASENSIDIEMSIRDDGTYIAFIDYAASRYSEKSMRRFAQFLDDMLLILQDESLNLLSIVA